MVLSFSSCTVKESIIFNEDGSGTFLMTYDMSEVMAQMGDAFKDMDAEDQDVEGVMDEVEEKKPNTVIDSIIYFKDIFEEHKDSIASLSEDERRSMEAIKDMYMTMNMNEDLEIFNYGVGLNFKNIDELKDIQKRIEQAKTMNDQGDQLEMMKEGSPMGKYMGDSSHGVAYNLTETGFSRVTTMKKNEDGEEIDFNDTMEPGEDEYAKNLEGSFYIVEFTFPKSIKSTSLKNGVISKNGKSISYKVNWLNFIKDPKLLDISVEFEDE